MPTQTLSNNAGVSDDLIGPPRPLPTAEAEANPGLASALRRTHQPAEVALAPATRNGLSRRSIAVHTFADERLQAAKAGFSTRRVPLAAMRSLIAGPVRPRSGDVVLARVDRIGQHARLELTNGRKAKLHPGDEIIVAYGDRYAPDQFEAHIPGDLRPTQLVASGGVAAHVLSRSTGVSRATDITPLALVGDGRASQLNIGDFALAPVGPQTDRPRVIAVLGTSMNSGKTTTIRYLVNALSRGGHSPGASKVTGTGSGGDYWVMLDAGAHRMMDFTDVGLVSTYRVPLQVIERKLGELVDHLTAARSGIILVEVADGLYQRETAAIVHSQTFHDLVDGVIFAAGGAMSAAAGVAHLRRAELPVLAVSGRLTASPLATREAAAQCGVPVVTRQELESPASAEMIVGLASAPDPALEPSNGRLSENGATRLAGSVSP